MVYSLWYSTNIKKAIPNKPVGDGIGAVQDVCGCVYFIFRYTYGLLYINVGNGDVYYMINTMKNVDLRYITPGRFPDVS